MTVCRYADPLCPCQDGDVCHYSGMDEMNPCWQEVLFEFPPMYEEIARKFSLLGRRDVIFSWGHGCIYNPHQVSIPPELLAHEAVHGIRQSEGRLERSKGNRIIDWWKRYLEDIDFRLKEEMAAHRTEYQWLRSHGQRRQRRHANKHVAERLASPLYGSMISIPKARTALRAG